MNKCSTKEAQPEEDPSVAARLQRLQNNYEDFGMRHTVEGVLVVHDHGHPHILMLQIANAFFKLPGDYLRPGEEEVQGLKNRLDERLAPPQGSAFQFTEQHGIDNDWEIGDCLAQWWRPNFETFMVCQFRLSNRGSRPRPLCVIEKRSKRRGYLNLVYAVAVHNTSILMLWIMDYAYSFSRVTPL